MGVILVIVGSVVTYVSYDEIQKIQGYNSFGLPMDEFLREFSPELRGQYILAHYVVLIGSILLLTGVILLYLGIFSLKPLKSQVPLPAQRNEKKKAYKISTEDPLKVLQLRYAKGEITREEFLVMKNDIRGGHG